MRKRKNISGPSLLVTYRRRCILLERQNARLLNGSTHVECEKEIARLTQRVIDCENRWEEAEGEVLQLRNALGWQDDVLPMWECPSSSSWRRAPETLLLRPMQAASET